MSTQFEQRELAAEACFEEAKKAHTESDLESVALLMHQSIRLCLVNLVSRRLEGAAAFDAAVLDSDADEFRGYRSLLNGATVLGGMALIDEHGLGHLARVLQQRQEAQ